MKIDNKGNVQFTAYHKRVNQDSSSRVRRTIKKDQSFLPQYRLQAFGVQNECPDPNRISVAGTQKKAPRFCERSVVPEGKNIVLKSVFKLSTLCALGVETPENATKTSETMGGTTTVSPLLFMNNLKKLMVEANKNNKKRSFEAAGVGNSVLVEANNKRRGPAH
ncbi:MAG: hypothetical protein KBD23_04065 [Gammaproteobacteria bacterium]|nr:hypothetical protein [Gammaproteobacteria bacterium]MBP9729298.1 hypothetical protein [Gammaproteobacteria bacterium]